MPSLFVARRGASLLTLVDSYSESNKDNDAPLDVDQYNKAGQCFTAIAGNLKYMLFYLAKVGAPTGNAVATLYNLTGTFGTNAQPTGSALATSDNFDVTTLTTSFSLIAFKFSGVNQFTLVNGSNYCAAIEYAGGTIGVNYVRFGYDVSSPSHAGNFASYNIPVPGAWSGDNSVDMIFYVYV